MSLRFLPKKIEEFIFVQTGAGIMSGFFDQVMGNFQISETLLQTFEDDNEGIDPEDMATVLSSKKRKADEVDLAEEEEEEAEDEEQDHQNGGYYDNSAEDDDDDDEEEAGQESNKKNKKKKKKTKTAAIQPSFTLQEFIDERRDGGSFCILFFPLAARTGDLTTTFVGLTPIRARIGSGAAALASLKSNNIEWAMNHSCTSIVQTATARHGLMPVLRTYYNIAAQTALETEAVERCMLYVSLTAPSSLLLHLSSSSVGLRIRVRQSKCNFDPNWSLVSAVDHPITKSVSSDASALLMSCNESAVCVFDAKDSRCLKSFPFEQRAAFSLQYVALSPHLSGDKQFSFPITRGCIPFSGNITAIPFREVHTAGVSNGIEENDDGGLSLIATTVNAFGSTSTVKKEAEKWRFPTQFGEREKISISWQPPTVQNNVFGAPRKQVASWEQVCAPNTKVTIRKLYALAPMMHLQRTAKQNIDLREKATIQLACPTDKCLALAGQDELLGVLETKNKIKQKLTRPSFADYMAEFVNRNWLIVADGRTKLSYVSGDPQGWFFPPVHQAQLMTKAADLLSADFWVVSLFADIDCAMVCSLAPQALAAIATHLTSTTPLAAIFDTTLQTNPLRDRVAQLSGSRFKPPISCQASSSARSILRNLILSQQNIDTIPEFHLSEDSAEVMAADSLWKKNIQVLFLASLVLETPVSLIADVCYSVKMPQPMPSFLARTFAHRCCNLRLVQGGGDSLVVTDVTTDVSVKMIVQTLEESFLEFGIDVVRVETRADHDSALRVAIDRALQFTGSCVVMCHTDDADDIRRDLRHLVQSKSVFVLAPTQQIPASIPRRSGMVIARAHRFAFADIAQVLRSCTFESFRRLDVRLRYDGGVNECIWQCAVGDSFARSLPGADDLCQSALKNALCGRYCAIIGLPLAPFSATEYARGGPSIVDDLFFAVPHHKARSIAEFGVELDVDLLRSWHGADRLAQSIRIVDQQDISVVRPFQSMCDVGNRTELHCFANSRDIDEELKQRAEEPVFWAATDEVAGPFLHGWPVDSSVRYLNSMQFRRTSVARVALVDRSAFTMDVTKMIPQYSDNDVGKAMCHFVANADEERNDTLLGVDANRDGGGESNAEIFSDRASGSGSIFDGKRDNLRGCLSLHCLLGVFFSQPTRVDLFGELWTSVFHRLRASVSTSPNDPRPVGDRSIRAPWFFSYAACCRSPLPYLAHRRLDGRATQN